MRNKFIYIYSEILQIEFAKLFYIISIETYISHFVIRHNWTFAIWSLMTKFYLSSTLLHCISNSYQIYFHAFECDEGLPVMREKMDKRKRKLMRKKFWISKLQSRDQVYAKFQLRVKRIDIFLVFLFESCK